MVCQKRGMSRSSSMFTPPNSSPTNFDDPSNENRELVESEFVKVDRGLGAVMKYVAVVVLRLWRHCIAEIYHNVNERER